LLDFSSRRVISVRHLFDQTIRVWDVATGECKRVLKGVTGVSVVSILSTSCVGCDHGGVFDCVGRSWLGKWINQESNTFH
jgi:WD40 repeat protein